MDFLQAKETLFSRLGDHGYMVLATSAGDKPLACTMTCLFIGGAVYMQTDSAFEKYGQIKQNPKVALCSGSLQMEGTASFEGGPLTALEGEFARLFTRYYPESFALYAKVPTEVVIKVTPTHAVDWLYEKGASEMLEIDFLKEEASSLCYENAVSKKED